MNRARISTGRLTVTGGFSAGGMGGAGGGGLGAAVGRAAPRLIFVCGAAGSTLTIDGMPYVLTSDYALGTPRTGTALSFGIPGTGGAGGQGAGGGGDPGQPGTVSATGNPGATGNAYVIMASRLDERTHW